MNYHLEVHVYVDLPSYEEASEMGKAIIGRCPAAAEITVKIEREVDSDDDE